MMLLTCVPHVEVGKGCSEKPWLVGTVVYDAQK